VVGERDNWACFARYNAWNLVMPPNNTSGGLIDNGHRPVRSSANLVETLSYRQLVIEVFDLIDPPAIRDWPVNVIG
jgi:hypothetical protein